MKKRILILSLILAMILAASIAGILYAHYTASSGSLYANIYQDNTLIETIDLNAVTEVYQIRVEYGEDDYNVIEVRPGSIGIVEASCPDLLCENMGFIDNSLMPVTCLPNHLVIQITDEGGDTDSTMDGVAY